MTSTKNGYFLTPASTHIRKNEQQICCKRAKEPVNKQKIVRPPHLLSVWMP